MSKGVHCLVRGARNASQRTVESCRLIDINAFTAVVKRPGSRGTISWGDSEDSSASITVYVEGDPRTGDRASSIRLVYTVAHGADAQLYDYRVTLEYTACHLGGSRPWVRCPGIVDCEHCDRRVRKLYKPPQADRYLCRHCYCMGYTSSRVSHDTVKTAELRYRRAFAKADARDRRPHPTDNPREPEQPLDMGYTEYVTLVERVRDARAEWNAMTPSRLRDIHTRIV